MQKISVVLATYNEEENIGRCLESVKDFAGEIVVVDGSSTDKTREIAGKFKARIEIADNPPVFHINKQKAIGLASGDWILQLDADEVVPKELAKEIVTAVNSDNANDGYYLKRKNFFLGRWLKKGGQYPDRLVRLFKKGKGKFPCKSVHEQIEITGSIGNLQNDLLHYTAPTFSRYLLNSNRYTSLTALEMEEKKIVINSENTIKYCILKPLATFLSLYFRHKGFLDGFPGFVFACFSGLHHFSSFIKYWEISKK